MGNVSTVLSEEALSKCLTKSIYEGASVDCDGEKDDSKCGICQVLPYRTLHTIYQCKLYASFALVISYQDWFEFNEIEFMDFCFAGRICKWR